MCSLPSWDSRANAFCRRQIVTIFGFVGHWSLRATELKGTCLVRARPQHTGHNTHSTHRKQHTQDTAHNTHSTTQYTTHGTQHIAHRTQHTQHHTGHNIVHRTQHTQHLTEKKQSMSIVWAMCGAEV